MRSYLIVINPVNSIPKYSRTPFIRTLVIRLANYPDRLGPSSKHFLTVIVLYCTILYYIVLYFLSLKLSPSHLSNTYRVAQK